MIPEILGQSIQEIQMNWGNPDATSESKENAAPDELQLSASNHSDLPSGNQT